MKQNVTLKCRQEWIGTWFWNIVFYALLLFFLLFYFLILIKCISHLTFILDTLSVCIYFTSRRAVTLLAPSAWRLTKVLLCKLMKEKKSGFVTRQKVK